MNKEEEVLVQGACASCKFGTIKAYLIVLDNYGFTINDKKVATDITLGNVFAAPCFGICKANPNIPKPCVPTVISWSGLYRKFLVNDYLYPLLDSSTGTCALGFPKCIKFLKSGQ